MTNVEKLKELNKLGDIRESLGAENESDDSRDTLINDLSNSQLTSQLSEWEIGEHILWNKLKTFYDRLEKLDKKE